MTACGSAGERGLIAGQLCPVFMWCRKLDVGAHHPCWLPLQALFMTASVLTITSTTAMTAITSGVFIMASRPPTTHGLNFRGLNMNLR